MKSKKLTISNFLTGLLDLKIGVSILLVLAHFSLFAQTPPNQQITCGGVDFGDTVPTKSLVCTPIETDYTSDYQLINHYKNYDNQAIKTVQIALHIFRDDNGVFIDDRDTSTTADDTLIWQDDYNTADYVQQMEDWMNEKYQILAPSSETYASPIFHEDAKIRIDIVAIYFYDNTTLYNGGAWTGQYENYVSTNFPERLKYLPIYVPKSFGYGHAQVPSFQSDDVMHWVTSGITPSYAAAVHIAHELGHNLDLGHPYTCCYGESPYDCCGAETLDSNNVDWVDDLFDYTNFWCAGNPENKIAENTFQVCYDKIGNCDPWANDEFNHCTNNFMGAVNIPYDTIVHLCCGVHLTPAQIAKMHRACAIKSIRRYVWGYSTLPYEVTKNETWDFSIKYYQDIVVKSGSILTIKCDVQMVPQAKIIVEPGARLVIDGGHIRNAVNSDDFWQGIQVYGHTNLPQSFANQGAVILKNGAIIENAQNAIQVWKQDDWSSTGGIVKAYDSYFINNRRDVAYLAYQNFNAYTGVKHPNLGTFINCEFTWNDAFMAEHPAQAHITMFKVDGITVLGCDFADNRTTLDKDNTGSGIFSIDAKYKVLARNTGAVPPGTPEDEYYSEVNKDVCTFTRLHSGVEALDANTQNTITVDHAKFIDCQYGVMLSQVDNAMITRNKFEFNGTESIWIKDAIDIIADRSTAFQIEGNDMTSAIMPADVLHSPVGVRIENAWDAPNDVFKNKMNALSLGAHAFGRNRATGTGITATGLQFLCNEYSNSAYSDEFVQKDANLTYNGIRILQGGFVYPNTYSAAGNDFSASIASGGPAYDTHISSLFDISTNYVYSTMQALGKPTENYGLVSLIQVNPLPTCPTNFTTISVGVGSPVSASTSASLQTQFGGLTTQIATKKTLLDVSMALGDNLSLHVLVALLNPLTQFATRAALCLSSPYLSESLLRELADQSPFNFPSEWLKEMVIDNIEVAKNPDFLNYLSEKTHPMSQSQIDEIKAHLNDYTERGERELDILTLKTNQARIANILIKGIVQDSLGANKENFQEWVRKRADVSAGFQLTDDLLERGEKQAANAVLDSLENLLGVITLESQRKEMEYYIAFKREMISFSNEYGTLEGLSVEGTESRIRFYAKNAFGYAQVQAQNLLCFFKGECKTYPVNLPLGEKSLQIPPSNKEENQTTAPVINQVNALTIFPNPTKDRVRIALDELIGGEHIIIMDVLGRIVLQQNMEINNMELDISMLNKGIYSVVVFSSQDEKRGTASLVIQ